ncbi:helix-turn-helix domain-containing protein [[Enterobacter] lignolyticus]|uniref:HTH luxR-type domain-containing protein n=1 Tax=[Enterobacter] lignolyticus TaxID=1334193 RepID=A0A806X459_9ENTR|nr:LuxR C-terminal-related transcriptional regulator [[Enterobacter] lignolyticus]ALR76324.1 hypothetical protein AO703_08450 [[Enterobacter] lignolyticus]
MLKILILSEDKYYADGLSRLIQDVAEALCSDPVIFLSPAASGDYLLADMAFCDIPASTGLRCCSLGFSYHLHFRMSPVCCYTGLYDGEGDTLPCPGQFSSLLSRRAPETVVRDVLCRQMMEMKTAPYYRRRRSVCRGCRLPVLTSRELDVLSEISRGGSVLKIARAMGISDKTVSTYKCRMMKKLGDRNGHMLYRYAIWFANLLSEPEETPGHEEFYSGR